MNTHDGANHGTNHRTYGTYGSGLTYQTEGSNVGKVAPINMQKNRRTFITIMIVSGLILLLIGGLILILVLSSDKDQDRESITETTILPTTATPMLPTTTETTSKPKPIPVWQKIRADYPWTESHCGIRGYVDGSQRSQQSQSVAAVAAGPGEFPWVLAVLNIAQRGTPFESSQFVCFAALVAPHWVLTSASCCERIIPSENDAETNFTALYVTEGFWIPNKLPAEPRFYRHARYCRTHPEFETTPVKVAAAAVENDIALMRLSQKLDRISLDGGSGLILLTPICLPPVSRLPLARPQFQFFEFARYSSGSLPDANNRGVLLSRTEFEIVSVCEREKVASILTFCRTAKSSEPGLCHGDSGGPLTQQLSDSGVEESNVLFGVAVSSISDASNESNDSDCQNFIKTQFVNVVRHARWINSTVYQNDGP